MLEINGDLPKVAAREPAEPSLLPAGALESAQRSSRYALLSMALLVVQGTCLSIALRYSRTRAGIPYLASVSGERCGVVARWPVLYAGCFPCVSERCPSSVCALCRPWCSVLVTEVVKLAICSAVQLRAAAATARSVGEPFLKEARLQARGIASKALPMLLPAGMFVMQQVCCGGGERGRAPPDQSERRHRERRDVCMPTVTTKGRCHPRNDSPM